MKRSQILLALHGLMVVFLVAGCSNYDNVMSRNERTARIENDKNAIFATQEPVRRSITLCEAMARAMKYNLDLRLKAADAILARGDFNVSEFDMLPGIVASAGYLSRSNPLAVKSSPDSNIISFAEDRHRRVADLQMTWNILDFGVSYINSRQKGDEFLIALERRRKMQQNIIRDVRYAFYRSMSAQRLLSKIDPLMRQVKSALAKSQRLEKDQTQSPLDALRYQKTLLTTLRELTNLQRDLMNSKKELAALMSLPPSQNFVVNAAYNPKQALPGNFPKKVRELEYLGLQYRPELREEDYHTRINVNEVTKARLRMLPGLEFNIGENYDSNSFIVNNSWANSGVRLTWNLINLLSAPMRIGRAQSDVKVADIRRMALSMAVLTQVDVAFLRYHQSRKEVEIANKEQNVTRRLYSQINTAYRAQKASELELIQAKTDMLLADLRKDLTEAEYQNAAGQVLSSVGYDVIPILDTGKSVAALTNDIRLGLGTVPVWQRDGRTYDTPHARMDDQYAGEMRAPRVVMRNPARRPRSLAQQPAVMQVDSSPRQTMPYEVDI